MTTRPQFDSCNRPGALLVALAGLLSTAFAATPARAETDLAQSITNQIEALVATEQQTPLTETAVEELYRAAVKQHGNSKPLLAWLAETRGDGRDTRAQMLAEIEVHVAARRGDLKYANRVLTSLLEIESVAAARLDLRLWQARLFDALGEITKAKEAYQGLKTADLNETDQQTVRLRLALMGLLGDGSSNSAKNAKDLIDLAEASDDIAFRNRAANVLAVQNQHAEAIKLFVVEGNETARFRSASRVAEWAIRAKDRDKAIASAWDAVRSAQMKRDRRYALTLLVEAHRMEKKQEGLIALIDAFAAEESKKEAVSDEMRSVWVDLLRELGRYDDAIALFKTSAAEGGFSAELRRELLEMEGEAGNVEQMIASYRAVIAAEPDQLTWRGGLTRVLLEQGDPEGAAELWDTYLDQLTSGTELLQAAQTLGDVGLNDLAARAVERMVKLKVNHGQALLYLADLQRRRGHMAESEATLGRLHVLTDAGDAVRAELAGAYERLGRQDKAVEVMEQIRSGRETVAEDLEMRLAWLYSEIGDEEKALEQWLALWRKVTSVARRRYVEERIMTVASRLGSLADIAIDLEVKLQDGKADDREAGLLVRIYSRVNDSIAATEILETYMSQTGRNEVDRLQEKGRIYQICNDYWNYEKVVERLIEVDPDGRTDYLRQLALSMLERGKAQEARTVLLKLRDTATSEDSIDGEFEAGILSMVGLKQDATDAYRRAIAQHPDRIECYLLLANLLKEVGETERAVGMFQFLAESADKDDLFTIAIDGLLNMEADRRVMQWARRITLERLAGREDKNYLYQLLADLSAEVNDRSGQVRALENSLAVSGNRRLSVLRECMDLSTKIRSGVYYRSGTKGPSNAGNEPFFAFGRRLIGLGELMPPQVFIDLGQAFLAGDDLVSAKRTFGLARNVADERGYERQVARIFEVAGHRTEALARYDRLLRTSPSDLALIARVAKLNEQEGHDAIAARFYQRGHNLLMAQLPLTTREAAVKPGKYAYYRRGNVDAHQTYAEQLLRGILVTIPDDAVDDLLAQQQASLDESLLALAAQDEEGRAAEKLAEAPRIKRRSEALRRLYFAFDRVTELEAMDLALLRQFKADTSLPLQMVNARISRGRYDSVQRLVGSTAINDEQRRKIAVILGQSVVDDEGPLALPPSEMWRGLIPTLITRDVESARRLLRRVDTSKATRSSRNSSGLMLVNGVYVRVPGTASPGDVSAWMRLAIVLGDEGLALQFARTRVQQHKATGRTVPQMMQIIESCRGILPDESFQSLVRFSANLFREDEQHTAEYIWLASEFGGTLGEGCPTDEQLLALIEERELRLSYQLSAIQVLEMLPESIRAQALSLTIANTDAKMRPRYLVAIPFQYEKPLGEEVSQAIANGIASRLKSGMKMSEMRQFTYMIPQRTPWLRCADNADAALKVLDKFQDEAVGAVYSDLPVMARMIKGLILKQVGREDEALEIALAAYKMSPEPKDHYARNARSALLREMIASAPQPFLSLVADDAPDVPSVSHTDKVLGLIRQSSNEAMIRAAYEKAWYDHPDETKYARAYEQWETRARRPMKAIAINQRMLDNAKTEVSTASIERSLSNLWISKGHMVNGLPFWSTVDDEDREQFEKQQAERAKSQPEDKSAKPATAASTSRSIPAMRVVSSSGSRAVFTTSIIRGDSRSNKAVTELHEAMEAGDKEVAQEKLRGIWRAFPPVDANPYGRVYGRTNLSGLWWPRPPKTEEAAPPEVEDRLAARAKRRRQLRGGLATFNPVVKPPVKATPPQSLWKALAGEPFAVAEMQRLLRSRQYHEVRALNEVVLGLLQADRLARGDDAVFAGLLDDVRQGRAGHIELVQLFAMIQENPARINAGHQDALTDLLRQLDKNQLQMLSQLAPLCGSVGQKDRSSALYTYCALRGSSFSSLISGAKKVFAGDELMALAERMYAVTPNNHASHGTLMLDLRLKHLPADEALSRSVEMFKNLDGDAKSIPTGLAVRGVQLFAQAGQFQKAQACLRIVLRGQITPFYSPYSSYRPNRPQSRLSRSDIPRMFPEDGSAYDDYPAWLAAASEQVAQLLDREDIAKPTAIEMQVVIALRQSQQNNADAALATLASVRDLLSKDGRPHAELAIDAMRQAGRFDQALQLQTTLYEKEQLPYVRLGDLLRDTAQVHGRTSALELMEKLLAQSLDEDLMEAALELVADDSQHLERISDLHCRNLAALDEYERRLQDRRLRDQTRARWREEDKRKKAK